MGNTTSAKIQSASQNLASSLQAGAAGLGQVTSAAGAAAAQLQDTASRAGLSPDMLARLKVGGAYDLVKRHYAASVGAGLEEGTSIKDCGGVTGGGFFGGGKDEDAQAATELREYEYSLASKAKEDAIRRVAAAMKSAGIHVDPEADIDVVIKTLQAEIPNPKKNSKRFMADAEKQKNVCVQVAKALNKQFSPFIDETLSPVAVCRQLGEWVHSLSAGVYSEFLEVVADVRRVLRNLEVLEEVMRKAYDETQKRLPALESPEHAKASGELAALDELYRRAERERQRQEAVLKNLLHVELAPAQKELEAALKDQTEAHALVERIGLKPGSSAFSEALAAAVSGVGSAAAVARQVDKALKAAGLRVAEYVDSPDAAAFHKMLDAKLMSGSAKDAGKFLEAAEVLRQNFARRGELRADLTTGGADEEKKSEIQKRIERTKTDRKLIMKEFASKTKKDYLEIREAVAAVVAQLGKAIPLSEKTDALRDALERLQEQARAGAVPKIEIALVGLAVDVGARERKERFLSALRLVSGALAALLEAPAYSGAQAPLSRFKAAVDGLIRSVDYFSDIITKKYGERVGAGEDDDYAGGAGELGEYMGEASTASLSLQEALGTFDYQYYVARVRTNLAETAKELDKYGEKYTDLLGDAVAARLTKLEATRKAIADRLDGKTTTPAPHILFTAAAAAGAAGEEAKKRLEAVKKYIAAQIDTKKKFYSALQAVDLYMKAFTNGIANNPDAVLDLRRILDGTQVIARWFNEEAGDSLWQAFELMPTFDGAGKAELADDNKIAGAGHYYERVAGRPDAPRPRPGLVGIPQLGRDPESPQAKEVADKIGVVFENFQALKNLVNAFARIGDKFGGKELAAQVFMTPTQIFKALTTYLKCSALSMRYNEETGDALPNLQLNVGAAAIPDAVVGDRFQIYFSSTFDFTPAGGAKQDFRGNWQVEDRYFQLAIKSIAAKVLTVLGVYDMFEREQPIADLTPTRMIVGGADEADPEAEADAAELYFRLPRLVEFYRKFLRWDPDSGDDGAKAKKIAMLPELEGTFSGIIRLVFMKMGDSSLSGDYSDSEIKAMVAEVNAIHRVFRSSHGDKAVSEAINGLVREVNRRFGVIKADDMKQYWASVREARQITLEGSLTTGNNTNYSILPNEDEYEAERRAPSDRFLELVGAEGKELKREFEGSIDTSDWNDKDAPEDHYKRFKDFRKRLEEVLFANGGAPSGRVSYSTLIRQTALEMKRSSSKDAKLALAMKLIQGTTSVGLESNKSLMFHETVVVGVNILSALQSLLLRFANKLDALDLERSAGGLRDFFIAQLAEGAPFGGGLTRAALLNNISDDYADPFSAEEKHTGRRAEAEPYLLADGTNVMLRAGADASVTIDQVRAYLRTWAVATRGSGLSSAAAYSAAFADAQVAQLANWARTPPSTQAAASYEAVMSLALRLSFNFPAAMSDLVENIYDLVDGSKDLVQLRFPGTSELQLQFDFTRLASLCEALMSDVRYFLDQFRPFMPRDVIDRFERSSSEGSIFWLEKNLMERFFRGPAGLGGIPDSSNSLTVETLSRKANRIFVYYTRDTYAKGAVYTAPFTAQGSNIQKMLQAFYANTGAQTLTAAALAAGGAAAALAAGGAAAALPAALPASAADRRETYGRTFAGIIWYDVVNLDTVNIPSQALAGDNYGLHDLIRADRPAAAGGGAPTPFLWQRSGVYDGGPSLTDNRSLFFAFNQILAKYLLRLIDPSGGFKVYLPLINSYANGVASQAVTTPRSAYPDLSTAAAATFGFRGDPKPTLILFQSLALILQRLIKDANPATMIPDHAVSTLADIPIYQKEAFRADLPGFIRLFDTLTQKCEFIKQFVQKATALKLDRPSTAALVAIRSAGAGVGGEVRIRSGGDYAATSAAHYGIEIDPLQGAASDSEMRAKIAAMCDAISTSAYTLSAAAAEVRKELADRTVYLQTQENAIEIYKERYGTLPVMPLSLAFFYLQNSTGAHDSRLFPDHALGEPLFKLMYGVRGLLIDNGAAPGPDHMPGVRAILDGYNSMSTARDQIPADRYYSFTSKVVGSLRWIVGARVWRAAVSVGSVANGGLFSLPNLTGERGVGIRPAPDATGNAVYAFSATAQDLVEIAESSNQDDQIRKIVGVVGGAVGVPMADSRDRERLNNLVDLNIIPINLHALMRDIPLVNLFNYSYTFEQFSCLVYGLSPSQISETDDSKIKTTRHMFLRLLKCPYSPVSKQLYGSDLTNFGTGGFVHRIFRGDNNLGLGRPKFLSDQLFGKALFGSLFPAPQDFDEAGPGAGSASARGRDGSMYGRSPNRSPAQNLQNELLAEIAQARGDINPLLDAAVAAGTAAALTRLSEKILEWSSRIRSWPTRVQRLATLVGTSNNPVIRLLVSDGNSVLDAATAVTASLQVLLNDAAAPRGSAQVAVAPNLLVNAQGLNASLDTAAGGNRLHGKLSAVVLFAGAAGVGASSPPWPTGDGTESFGILQNDPRSRVLTYLPKTSANDADMTSVKFVNVGAAAKAALENAAIFRWNTKLARNLFLIPNLNRLIRMKLNQELAQNRSVIAKSHDAVSATITEYGSSASFGPNETYSDQTYLE